MCGPAALSGESRRSLGAFLTDSRPRNGDRWLEPEASVTTLLRAPVLIATDGTDDSAGALAVAAHLARLRGANIRPLTVLERGGFPTAGGEPLAASTAEWLADSEIEQRARETVRRQVEAFLGPNAGGGVTFARGRVVSTIAKEAESAGVGLIMLGLHPHDLFDRISGEETALRVAGTARLPLLAVTAKLSRLPRRCVVGVDFSPASERAAREALPLLDDGATMVLAHVRPTVADRDRERSGQSYVLGVAEALARIQASLPSPSRVTVETITLEGETALQLLALADRSGADLIAVGSHRHSFVGRFVLGSVVTTLIRAASVSLFVTPPSVPPADQGAFGPS